MKSQRGFSLPELMIGLGLVGGISIVMMKMVEDQSNNEAYLKNRVEISKVVSLVKMSLNDPENCRAMMAGAIIDTSNARTPTVLGTAGSWVTSGGNSLAIPLKTDPNSYKEIIKANTTYNGFSTTNITISRPTSAASNVVELNITFRMKARNSKVWSPSGAATANDREIVEKIPFTAKLVTDLGSVTRISDCGGTVSETNLVAQRKFCDSLMGAATWDSATNTCKFRELLCPYGQVVVQMTNLGGIVCGDIRSQIRVDELFDTVSECSSSTGQYQIINVGGRLRINCL